MNGLPVSESDKDVLVGGVCVAIFMVSAAVSLFFYYVGFFS